MPVLSSGIYLEPEGFLLEESQSLMHEIIVWRYEDDVFQKMPRNLSHFSPMDTARKRDDVIKTIGRISLARLPSQPRHQ